jgi:hypothetical protein
MTSEDIVEQISSAIIAGFFPPKSWCAEATNNELNKALLAVLNGNGIHKVAHMDALENLDKVLNTLNFEMKINMGLVSEMEVFMYKNKLNICQCCGEKVCLESLDAAKHGDY